MTSLSYDVCIVGTGAGGGAVAAELAPLCRKGLKVCLLEAGPHYTRENFNQMEKDMSRLYWERGAQGTRDMSVMIARGKCVGGSTTVYTGVSFRASQEVIEGWNQIGKLSISWKDLTSRYEKIEREINVHELPESMVNGNNQAFRNGCVQLGWRCLPLKFNLVDCEECGFCNLGCAYGSMQGTLQVQLPIAVGAGAELFPNCHVDRVEEGRVSGTCFPAPPGTSQGKIHPGDFEIRAKVIVLAAGALGSPSILLRSPVADRLPMVGRNLTLHPALMVYGVMENNIVNYRGFPKTFYCDNFSLSHGYLLETAFYFPFVTAKAVPGFGLQHRKIMEAYHRLACILILNHDHAEPFNRIQVSRDGKTEICYTVSSNTVGSLTHAMKSAAKILYAGGAKMAVIPASREYFIEKEKAGDINELVQPACFQKNRISISSGHPQGGCAMGNNSRTGVVDEFGKVFGTKSIFVCDASIFPGSVKVNPYLTVMAFAHRSTEFICHSLG